MNCNMAGFPVLHYLPEFAQIHVHWLVMLSNQLILCFPLLLLPSIFPSIGVFSNDFTVCIRWQKVLELQHQKRRWLDGITDSMDMSLSNLQEMLRTGMPSNHLLFCCPLLLLPSIFPSIGVFSNDFTVCIRWQKVLELQHQFFQ